MLNNTVRRRHIAAHYSTTNGSTSHRQESHQEAYVFYEPFLLVSRNEVRHVEKGRKVTIAEPLKVHESMNR